MAQLVPFVGHWYSIKSIQEFSKDYLKPQEMLFKKYGDRVALARRPSIILLYHPDDIQHVLRTNHKNYLKSDELRELWPVLGRGLVTNDGDSWKKHRKAIAPEFSNTHMPAYHEIFVKHIAQFLREQKKQGKICLNPALSQLTYNIAGESFFGATVGESAETIYKSIDLVSEFAVKRMARPLNIPYSWKVPSHRHVHNTVAAMNEVVFGIINERVNDPDAAAKKDVLTRLTRIVGDTGQPMFSVEEIRDEVMTLLLAGHETTANALCWTFYLLGKYKDIQGRVREEVRSVMRDEIPTLEEIGQLKYTRQVLNESMRLFPPVPMLGRKAIGEDEVSGYRIPAGSRVNLSQYITHRHPEFWVEPEKFLPARFENENNIYPYSFFPFGGGPRECVGKQMAMMEAICVLASLVGSFEFELDSEDIHMRALITLRPSPDVMMAVSPV